MKKLLDFLNESDTSTANYQTALKIMRFLEKKLNQAYFDFDGQNYTNSSGNYFGYLFISKEDTSAIRINFEGNKFHSINFWQDWNYNVDPTIEIFTSDIEPNQAAFTRLLPDIANIILDNNSFEGEEKYEEVDESVLTEAKKFEYDGVIYNGKPELVKKLYDQDEDVETIMSIVGLNEPEIKSIVGKYLYDKGGNVTDVATALGVSNQEARKLVTLTNDDENVITNEFLKVVDGTKETSTPTKAMKKQQENLDQIEYADPEFVFDEFTSYATLISKGVLPSLFVCGQGGIGKNFNIDKILEKYGKKHETWEKVSGKMNKKQLFNTLWENKDKILVFEDCDQILKDADTLNVIKSVLISNDFREVVWDGDGDEFVDTMNIDDNKEIETAVETFNEDNKGKKGIPNHFIFEGGVIFISKLKKADLLKLDASLPNRCAFLDIVFSAKDVIKRLETILPSLKIFKALSPNGNEKDITNEDLKAETLNYMKSETFMKNPNIRGKEITYRIFQNLYKLKWANVIDFEKRSMYCID